MQKREATTPVNVQSPHAFASEETQFDAYVANA